MEEPFICNFHAQHDNIASHSLKNIDLLERYGSFVKDFALIEADYAAKVQRLARTYQNKVRDEEDSLVLVRAFEQTLRELFKVGTQHEEISHAMHDKVTKEIVVLAKDLREERKEYLTEGTRLQEQMDVSLAQLDKAKRHYARASKESERAYANHLRADSNLNLSRAEAEKAKLIYHSKSDACDDSKRELAAQMKRTNEAQWQHYHMAMPRMFQKLRGFEERQLESFRKYLELTAELLRDVIPTVERAIDGALEAAAIIRPKEDAQLAIDKYRSRASHPSEYTFDNINESASVPSENSDPTPPETVSTSPPKSTVSAISETVSIHRSKSNGSQSKFIANLFPKKNPFNFLGSNRSSISTSPPSLDSKLEIKTSNSIEIKSQIEVIRNNIEKEDTVREALVKLQQTYQSNTKLGDPNVIEGEINQSAKRLNSLVSELKQYQTLETEIGSSSSELNQPRSRNSIANIARLIGGRSQSHCFKVSDFDQENDLDSINETDVVGMATTLYSFEAQSVNSLTVNEGEDLEVIQNDRGDGWTWVRRPGTLETGYVPTNYLKFS